MSGTSRQKLTAICLLIFSLVSGLSPALADTGKKKAAKVTTAGVHYKAVKTLNLRPIFGCKSDWHVTFFEPSPKFDKEEMPVEMPGKISFWTDPSKKEENAREVKLIRVDDSIQTNFQSLGDLSIVKLDGSRRGVVLHANNEALIGNHPYHVETWAYDKDSDYFYMANFVDLYDQSEYRFIDKGEMAGCFITASAYFQTPETKVDDHHFIIKVYKTRGWEYLNVLEYWSVGKHPPIDPDSGEINVISLEMANIKKNLSAIYGKDGLAKIFK